jgi:hypothetical protein
MRRLLKFKCDKDRCEVLVKYDITAKGGGVDTITLEGNERPSVALIAQLSRMAQHLVAIAELPKDWQDELTIIGVTRTIGEGTGLVITGLRELVHQDAPLCINSPHTTEFSVQCREDLLELERLVLRYVDGDERAQLTLKLDEKPREAAHNVN